MGQIKSVKEIQTEGTNRNIRQINSFIKTGTGSPEGVVIAPVGTIYLRKDGGVSTTLYIKTSGTSNTGWTGK